VGLNSQVLLKLALVFAYELVLENNWNIELTNSGGSYFGKNEIHSTYHPGQYLRWFQPIQGTK